MLRDLEAGGQVEGDHIVGWMLALARKHSLIVIDHDMTFVRQIAMKVTVLDEGRILCQGTMQEVQRDPRVIEVYLGQDREADAKDRKALHRVR